MNRTIAALFLLIAVFGGLWYWWARRDAGPSIVLTSPAGGEAWQAGESHPITWSSRGIPANWKVSITLRRIPPPPLQEEGQEFDPLVFTGLANTGSTTWQISAQYPGGTYALSIHAYESVPVTNEVSSESAEFTVEHPKVAIDAYPLYAGVAWQNSVAETFLIGTTTYAGASIASFPVTDTKDPGSIFTPFERYYSKLLVERGYHVVNELAAGEHVGGQTGYSNGATTILTRFHIDYKTVPENAPSACPCDVTLSLFSSPANAD